MAQDEDGQTRLQIAKDRTDQWIEKTEGQRANAEAESSSHDATKGDHSEGGNIDGALQADSPQNRAENRRDNFVHATRVDGALQAEAKLDHHGHLEIDRGTKLDHRGHLEIYRDGSKTKTKIGRFCTGASSPQPNPGEPPTQ